MPALALEVGEDLADGGRLLDEGDDPHQLAALAAGQRVDLIAPALP